MEKVIKAAKTTNGVTDKLLECVRGVASKNVVQRMTEFDVLLTAAKEVFPNVVQQAAYKASGDTVNNTTPMLQVCGAIQCACKRQDPGETRASLVQAGASSSPNEGSLIEEATR